MKTKILVADDEYGIREFMFELFKEEYQVLLAENGVEAIEILEKEKPDVSLIDMRMPKKSGLDVLHYMSKHNLDSIPIVITADREVSNAVEAMKLGAYDYITKPLDYQKLSIIVRNAVEKKSLEEKLDILEKEVKPNIAYSNIIGQSKVMRAVYQQIENVTNNDATVLVYGESGTGKELIARAIHYSGNRSTKPFIPVDCASFPSSLIEAELFGYEKGAFTGATKATPGKFEMANQGTLFLDEISNITMEAQAKLLRVIQEKEFTRLGSSKNISVDVRIVSASNKDLKDMIQKGEFREDLYYRLNVIPITLPPLRDRKDDLPMLISHFLKKYNRQYEKNTNLHSRTFQTLLNYSWPGNIRELENLMNRLVLSTNQDVILQDDLPEEIVQIPQLKNTHNELLDQDMELDSLENIYIKNILERHDYNISEASNILGITRKTLYAKMEKFGIKKG